MRLGTGAIEIKSGYGLTIDGELKCFGSKNNVTKLSHIYKATFRAHAIPLEYKEIEKDTLIF
jgi:imidazolonepropionase